MEKVLLDIKDGIATITLNSPANHNALDQQMSDEPRSRDQPDGVVVRLHEPQRVVAWGPRGSAATAGRWWEGPRPGSTARTPAPRRDSRFPRGAARKRCRRTRSRSQPVLSHAARSWPLPPPRSGGKSGRKSPLQRGAARGEAQRGGAVRREAKRPPPLQRSAEPCVERLGFVPIGCRIGPPANDRHRRGQEGSR